LRNVQNEARRLSVDVAYELRAIDVQIDLLERRGDKRDLDPESKPAGAAGWARGGLTSGAAARVPG
jgi:hypothetical protein